MKTLPILKASARELEEKIGESKKKNGEKNVSCTPHIVAVHRVAQGDETGASLHLTTGCTRHNVKA